MFFILHNSHTALFSVSKLLAVDEKKAAAVGAVAATTTTPAASAVSSLTKTTPVLAGLHARKLSASGGSGGEAMHMHMHTHTHGHAPITLICTYTLLRALYA